MKSARSIASLGESAHDQDFVANARPPDWINPPAPGRYGLVVIGGGPCGLVAARTAAALGAKVALVERDLLGGESLNHGAIPSKAIVRSARLYADMRNATNYGVKAPANLEIDVPAVLERMRRIRARLSRVDSAALLSKIGIDVHFGAARFVARNALEVGGVRLEFKKALIATGSRAQLPNIPGLVEAGFLTSETVFELKDLPPRLLVIGGGPLGCELAQAFSRLGRRIVIAHSEPLFLPKEERDAAHMVSDALARDAVEIHLNTEVVSVRVVDGCKVAELINDGNVATTTVDEILTGIGRVPAVEGLGLEAAGVQFDTERGVNVDDFLRTANPSIYAAGDACLEHKYANTAEASARIAVHNALSRGREKVSAMTIPWCTYTDPEVAHVGLYVKEARERNIPVKTLTVPIHDIDRAVTDGEEDGFVKIHVRDGTDVIVGATVVARDAGEMINAICLAMVAGIGLSTVAKSVHAYPTQGEAIWRAADGFRRPARSALLRRTSRSKGSGGEGDR